jgi:hypothetical protein
MTRRTRGDAVEHDAHRRQRAATDVTDGLFAQEQAAGARDAAIDESDRKAQIQRDIARLHPFVRSEALIAGGMTFAGSTGGITAGDVRRIGEEHGIFTGEETGRQLSWIGPAMAKSWGLVATTYVRRSKHRVDRSHGNRHTVYVHPDYASKP